MSEPSALSELKKTTKSQRYLIALLCVTNIVNYMDRVGMSSVLVQIQEHFKIGDAQGGLLQTVLLGAFTISAPIFGFLGDRYSRKWIIIVSMGVWCFFTVLGAFAIEFWMLLCSRMFVGIGQSGFTTIAPTLFSDIVLKGGRTVLLSCFYIGLPVGCGLGYITSVKVYDATGSWRYGLCMGPLIIVVLIILQCFAKFPKRGELEEMESETDSSNKDRKSFRTDLKYLINIPSFILLTMSFVCIAFVTAAMSWWMPKCLTNGFQLIPGAQTADKTSATFHFGLIVVTTGLLGILIGLGLSRLLRPRYQRADPLICGVGLVMASCFDAAALFLIPKSQILAFGFLFISMLSLNCNWAILMDMLLYILTPACRALGHGVHLFVGHLLGDCISPYIVGALSEYFKKNYALIRPDKLFESKSDDSKVDKETASRNFYALRTSLFVTIVFPVFGAIFFFIAAYYIVNDMAKVKSEEKNP